MVEVGHHHCQRGRNFVTLVRPCVGLSWHSHCHLYMSWIDLLDRTGWHLFGKLLVVLCIHHAVGWKLLLQCNVWWGKMLQKCSQLLESFTVSCCCGSAELHSSRLWFVRTECQLEHPSNMLCIHGMEPFYCYIVVSRYFWWPWVSTWLLIWGHCYAEGGDCISHLFT